MAVVLRTLDRQGSRCADGLDSRHGGDAAEQIAVFRIQAGLRRERSAERQHVIGTEAGIDGSQIRKAADQESRAGDEHQ